MEEASSERSAEESGDSGKDTVGHEELNIPSLLNRWTENKRRRDARACQLMVASD